MGRSPFAFMNAWVAVCAERIRVCALLLPLWASAPPVVDLSTVPEDDLAVRTLEVGVQIVEDRAYYASRIDWAVVDDEVAEMRRDVSLDVMDVHRYLRELVGRLDDPHSMFVALPRSRWPSRSIELPSGDVSNRIGFLQLPAISSPVDFNPGEVDPVAEEYVARARQVLQAEACGWIVDLRFFRGGWAAPPLGALAPLLGEGVALTYEYRDGTRTSVLIDSRGQVLLDNGSIMVQGTGELDLLQPRLPVAVLQYHTTGSAGEAVLLAFVGSPNARTFGSPTAGVPTNRRYWELPDGSGLVIADAVVLDQQSGSYDGRVPPDVTVRDAPVLGRERSEDPMVEAATDWIRETGDC